MLVWLWALALFGPAASAAPFERSEEREPCAARVAERRPFFGDTHVHTAFSFDASTQDTRNTPRDAYRFAKGEELGIQPYDEEGNATRRVRLDRPLDWVAVSDHSELLGEVRICTVPGQPGYDSLVCRIHRGWPHLAFQMIAGRTLVLRGRFGGICGENDADCPKVAGVVWQEIQDAAEEAYDRSAACRFTSFVGYEWTATVGGGVNLHHNVVFRNEKVPPLPISWVDTPSASELFDRLEEQCVQGIPGCDAITIPHNSNLSAGLMFETTTLTGEGDQGVPIGAAEARRRSRWEPLVEIMQHKGDSECAVQGQTTDEACGFEKLPYDRFGAKMSMFVREKFPERSSYVRSALSKGIRYQAEHGLNPFQFGIIASTDTHIATPGLTAEKDHPGHGGAGIGARGGVPLGFPDDLEFNPGGLAVLYAEENSRDALFAAMQRREAYGTSGTRPVVRLFGGWGYPATLCESEAFAAEGYAGGVPMGGELAERPAGAGPPRFAVSALKDPGGASGPGTPLQRIQIVKGWIEDGAEREQVFDVAGGENGASVDLATCTPRGAGQDRLCTVWSDPDFDPATPAYYYARVLENPVCRWSQYVCNAAKVDCAEPTAVSSELAGCCAEAHRPIIQERAWTSPVWYTPR